MDKHLSKLITMLQGQIEDKKVHLVRTQHMLLLKIMVEHRSGELLISKILMLVIPLLVINNVYRESNARISHRRGCKEDTCL